MARQYLHVNAAQDAVGAAAKGPCLGERPNAHDEWRPVAGADGYPSEVGRFNRVTFDRVETTALRIDMQLQPDMTAGIREWRVLPAE
ncbi:MAG: hypothetical protein ISS72_11385 [Candidatus Brocadiae bacterium]|nr:hypothetical protein [Candidatus Brocadiia bacterium]